MTVSGTARALDFTNVKDRGDVNPKHQPPNDYKGKVLSVKDIKMGETKRDAWMFIIQVNGGTYPYRCGFEEKELWKIRNLFVACGIAVPKKRIKVNPSLTVGKFCAVTLEDHEYEGKMSSQIAAVFPVADLGQDDLTDTEGDDEEEETEEETEAEAEDEPEEEEEEEEEPAPAPKKKAKPQVVEEEEEDDELESLDIEDI